MRNPRVLVGHGGERTESEEKADGLVTPTSAGIFTSGEKLEYATKSNIECNSGISKDI